MKEKQIEELGFRAFATVADRDAFLGTKFQHMKAIVHSDSGVNNGLYTLQSDLTTWLKSNDREFDFYVNDNIDTTSAPGFFIGPLTTPSSDSFDEIDSYTFEAKLDGAGSWDSIADDSALIIWIATNVTTSVIKWRLRVVTTYGVGKSGDSIVKLTYS